MERRRRNRMEKRKKDRDEEQPTATEEREERNPTQSDAIEPQRLGFACKFCQSTRTRILRTWNHPRDKVRRRKRQCDDCGARFDTLETYREGLERNGDSPS